MPHKHQLRERKFIQEVQDTQECRMFHLPLSEQEGFSTEEKYFVKLPKPDKIFYLNSAME